MKRHFPTNFVPFPPSYITQIDDSWHHLPSGIWMNYGEDLSQLCAYLKIMDILWPTTWIFSVAMVQNKITRLHLWIICPFFCTEALHWFWIQPLVMIFSISQNLNDGMVGERIRASALLAVSSQPCRQPHWGNWSWLHAQCTSVALFSNPAVAPYTTLMLLMWRTS